MIGELEQTLDYYLGTQKPDTLTTYHEVFIALSDPNPNPNPYPVYTVK